MRFEKVSYAEWCSSLPVWGCYTPEARIRELYDAIQLPTRSTMTAAGYDFKAPYDLSMFINGTEKVPTGIRVLLDDDKFLGIFPRSGLGFKYRLQLDNTVGIVDSDYYYSSNEGHIFVKITNDGHQDFIIKQGEGFAQGIIMQYFVTEDDNESEKQVRDGGFGSTDK